MLLDTLSSSTPYSEIELDYDGGLGLGGAPRNDLRSRSAFETSVISPLPFDWSPTEEGTPLLAMGARDIQSSPVLSQPSEQDDEAFPGEKENAIRLQILARKYAHQQISPEAEARLAIATARVLDLIPSVTAADYEELANFLEAGNRISERSASIRKSLLE